METLFCTVTDFSYMVMVKEVKERRSVWPSFPLFILSLKKYHTQQRTLVHVYFHLVTYA